MELGYEIGGVSVDGSICSLSLTADLRDDKRGRGIHGTAQHSTAQAIAGAFSVHCGV